MKLSESGLVSLSELLKKLTALKAAYESNCRTVEEKIVAFILQYLTPTVTENDNNFSDDVIRGILDFIGQPSSLTVLCPQLAMQSFYQPCPNRLRDEIKGFMLTTLRDWIVIAEEADQFFIIDSQTPLAEFFNQTRDAVKKLRHYHMGVERLYQYNLQSVNRVGARHSINTDAVDEQFVRTVRTPASPAVSIPERTRVLSSEEYLLRSLTLMTDIASSLPGDDAIHMRVEKTSSLALSTTADNTVGIRFEVSPQKARLIEVQETQKTAPRYALSPQLHFRYNTYQAKLQGQYEAGKNATYASRRLAKYRAFYTLNCKKDHCTPADFYQVKCEHPELFAATFHSEALVLWQNGKAYLKEKLWEDSLQESENSTFCITDGALLSKLRAALLSFSHDMHFPADNLQQGVNQWITQREQIPRDILHRFDKKCAIKFIVSQSDKGELNPRDIALVERAFPELYFLQFNFGRTSQTKLLMQSVCAHLKEALWIMAGGEGPERLTEVRQQITHKKAHARFRSIN